MITVICAQCKTILGEKEGGEEESHTLCGTCAAAQREEIERVRRILAIREIKEKINAGGGAQPSLFGVNDGDSLRKM